ncbi:MAG TPA: Crp/Fnr family transcriptional regulator [Aggregatilinea sp.]|jgi:CRP/FNR family transcriptional regulator/CRP/FNR family cyclic AMP-dependent transcriptional regulator|uniref:Crp/Fnr family transcriptional regulator n=1 Tax=Aggregatilinea sp. TaxID=2806333 RepID=UPI002BE9590B|nr:Crp/Fnr family transcriptional regulator [Aggregatilinea sp.]HML25045.1 Crp/Fnr family transcriptional regulator [Aggregatilinea sp.]
MSTEQFLRNVSLFANLTAAELEPLARRLVTREYEPGAVIFSQGSPGNSMYIVRSGLVDAVLTSEDGSERILAQFGPEQFFGEFGLLDGLPRSATMVAREPSDLLKLGRTEFFGFLEMYPAVSIKLLVLLSRRLRFALQTAEPLDAVPLPVRLARVLVQFAERYGDHDESRIQLSLRLTRGELAGILACPRSDAEQALAALDDQGLIGVRGLQLTIYDMVGLRAVASVDDESGEVPD